MNKVYKLVWSKVRNCYVVASELAKRHAKTSGCGTASRAVVAGVLASVISCGAYMPLADAANVTTRTVGDDHYATVDSGDIVGNAAGSILVGSGATVKNSSSNEIAIGDYAYSGGGNSIAIGGRWDNQYHMENEYSEYGTGTSAEGSNDIVVGSASHASGNDTIVMGTGIITTANKAVLIGGATSVTADNSVAIGYGSTATESNVISVGNNSVKRKLVNVANGTSANDVAALGQTETVSAGTNVRLTQSTNANGSKNQQIIVEGKGTVTNNNTGLINGATAYNELRPADGTYIRNGNTTASNLVLLDTNLNALDEDKAEADASNVAGYAQQWANAIGTGKVAEDDTKLVTGKAVYDALHDPNMEINVKSVTTQKLYATDAEITNDLSVGGDTHLHDTYIDGILDVKDDATFHKNVNVEKDLTVNGDTYLNKDLLLVSFFSFLF